MPAGRGCVIRMRVVVPRREGGSAVRLGCVDTVGPADDFGDLDPPFNPGGPVALCARAIGTCYAEELGAMLSERALPWGAIQVEVDAACVLDPPERRLDSVAVSSTIFDGDPRMHGQYAAAAKQARDQSVVGRMIRGNVAYKIGAIAVVADDACDGLALREQVGVGRVGSFPDDPCTLATRHLAAFNHHRHDEFVATLHPECVLEDMAFGSPLKARAVVAEYYRSWWDAFDLRVADVQGRCCGVKTIAVEARCIGTHAGQFRGFAPTRRPIELRVAALLCFRDGLMADARIYYDAASLHRQLGIAGDTPKSMTSGDLQ